MTIRLHLTCLGVLGALAATAVPNEINLNGSWAFRFEEGKSIEQVARPDFVATDTMTVPACYDMMPDYLCKRGTGLYRRAFTLEKSVDNAWLVIDGMGLRGDFRIDGKSLGVHPYPWARLELPTGPLAAGEHTLFAALDNRFDWQTLKLARPYYDFYCYGGFYHGVKLVFDNTKIFVRTRDYKTGEIEVEIGVGVGVGGGVGGGGGGGVGVDGERTLVFDGKNEVKTTFVNGRARVRVPGFKLWSPDHPNLHTVALKRSDDSSGRTVRATTRFGIRTVEARAKKIWLNGEPIYLKGANRHEAHPTFGAATPEAVMLTDIENLKAMGGNFFRGSHYQQAQRFLDLCDEKGVMVWEESLGWGNGSHSSMAKGELTNETFRVQQIHQTREMVRASFNHPSVIIFAYMNEFLSCDPAGKSLSDELVRTIKAEDSGRLVTFACSQTSRDIANDATDLVAYNTYPGWFDESGVGDPATFRRIVEANERSIVRYFRKKYPEKPIIVSETGFCGVYGAHDPAGAQWTEEFQAETLGTMLDVALADPDICGFTIWHFADARSYHRAGAPIRGKPFAQNLAGLYDGYRRPKAVVPVVRRRFRGEGK